MALAARAGMAVAVAGPCAHFFFDQLRSVHVYLSVSLCVCVCVCVNVSAFVCMWMRVAHDPLPIQSLTTRTHTTQ